LFTEKAAKYILINLFQKYLKIHNAIYEYINFIVKIVESEKL